MGIIARVNGADYGDGRNGEYCAAAGGERTAGNGANDRSRRRKSGRYVPARVGGRVGATPETEEGKEIAKARAAIEEFAGEYGLEQGLIQS
jgi:hypothetical protein